MAVEHTAIPLFEGQHNYVISSFDRAEKINELSQGRIPANRFYYMTAPHALISSLRNKNRQKAFDEGLARWIVQQTPELQIDDEPKQYSYEGHKVRLICGGTHPLWNGRVGRMPEGPADVATSQKQLFDAAIKHGLDKLTKYKCNSSESFRTALILEDVAGLQHERITRGLTSFEKAKIDELIDYIVVMASLNDQMIVGYMWKEKEEWNSFIPANRRFNFRGEH
jgi:hypothetical protein